ncbi:glycosyl transferase [Synechocystis sp. LEGE 06083]|uniref:glycosyl transferase n=1 Tax=Synechocystis sp. LEGE 06083 TaxID=915336 RepID=UPI0018818AD6|nr:glycosyl transferase [Synechocystis sp. LEGE 06083]MBE9196672.1 glycosyl transferase [Synechocystis sp. LEGE 06083]
MKRPTLYCAITGHGFGHAVRTACIARRVQELCPDVLVIMATRSPRWLLECYLEKPFIHRPVAFDVGVVQADSLQMDEDATRQALEDIYRRENTLVATESNYLRNNRVDLVLADIPALAVAIAHRADLPCWMSSNFGWNFIYRDWGDEFGEVIEKIERDYRQCDLLFQLPLAEPMEIFPRKIATGLLGGDPRYSKQMLREKFAIKTTKEKTILLTFGGLGLEAIPYQVLTKFPDYQFITFDAQAPRLDNLIIIKDKTYRPVDLMPLCDRIFSKPGFGTFAEALKWEVPIISLTRDGFAEAQVLLTGLQNYGEHQIVPHQQFFAGNWDFLLENPKKPRLTQKLDKHGDRQIAEKIVAQIS